MKTVPSVPIADSVLPEQQLRERAYFRWIDLGCPNGDDQAHWFWARQQLLETEPADHGPAPAPVSSANLALHHEAATSRSDPARRFHDRAPRDARLDVVAGEARQRIRGRHFDSSLRAQSKKPAH